MRILIAEDDAVSRRILEALLTKWGYEITVTCDGHQAWQALQRPDAPDLVLLDWMMPGMDGLEVCRHVRATESARHPYIVMLTAKGRKQDIVTALEAGADDHLTKPFDPEELRARLQVGLRILKMQRLLNDWVHELQTALANVTLLQGLLPICAYCKKVRDDQNYWQQVETYIADRSRAEFSHSICPDCYDRVVKPQLVSSPHRD